MSIAPVLRTAAPHYRITGDERTRVVHIVVEGFFDLDTLHRHFADYEAFVDRWRMYGRPVRVLIDAVNLLPHSPEGNAVVQRAVERIYHPQDRVATLVSSNLVKMQMRRALARDPLLEFFVSEQAAMTWLMAYA